MLNKKILIIEDDHVVAGIYRNRLQVDGFNVETASDGQQGLDKVQSFRPDLLVLDLMLPKVNGVEIIKFVRSQKEFESLPIIVFSNSYLSAMVQEAWKAGANTCLSKVNSTPRQVVDVIRNTLGTTTQASGAASEAQAPPEVKPTPSPAPVPVESPAPRPAAAEPSHESAFLADVRRTFLDSAPQLMSSLREMLATFIKATENETVRLNQLFELYRKVHTITSNAGVAGFRQISEMTVALEALLKELYENPKNITPSTLRTVAQTIDLLGELFRRSNLLDHYRPSPSHILVVDDEVISRRAITFALEKAHLKALTCDSAEGAIHLLSENRFDLIILDVDMPVMNGFQLCAKIRTNPEYSKVPIIFVTGLNDFESRTQSTLSGGNDFIAKPFLFMELAVKALTHVLRGHLAMLS